MAHKVSSFKKIVSNPLQVCISLKEKLVKLIEKPKLPDFNQSEVLNLFLRILFLIKIKISN